MVDYKLKDRVALITGANNPYGIGATTALSFAKEGSKVVIVYKKILKQYDENKANKNGPDRYHKANAGDASIVEEKLKDIGADYIVLEKDISDAESVKDIYSAVIKKYGRVDILVNNAAVCDEDGFDTIEKISQKIIDDTFSVNLRGSVLMIKEMIKNRSDYGRIINISTDAAQRFKNQIIYGASKSALEALTRSIALEVSKYQFTVNCVS